LVSRYSEPQRHYHNLSHIAECLVEYDAAREIAVDPVTVELAIWFHDAVYDSQASDNEERSAALARERLAPAERGVELSGVVAALILATKTHEPSAHPDAALLVDVDLSILGQPEGRFSSYELQIRREYAWVPDQTFAAKRAEILGRFLARDRIYTTAPFFSKYEVRARRNLERSMRALVSGRAAPPRR
jgi:predicted metal-dependent HD superfamily phosphohydrolase